MKKNMNERMEYESPKMDVIKVEAEDIIITSIGDDELNMIPGRT